MDFFFRKNSMSKFSTRARASSGVLQMMRMWCVRSAATRAGSRGYFEKPAYPARESHLPPLNPEKKSSAQARSWSLGGVIDHAESNGATPRLARALDREIWRYPGPLTPPALAAYCWSLVPLMTGVITAVTNRPYVNPPRTSLRISSSRSLLVGPIPRPSWA